MCPGEEVKITCVVVGAGELIWRIEPPEDSISFSLNELHLSGQDSIGFFSAVVTNYSRDPDISFLGNLTSELVVVASSQSVGREGKVIMCDDGLSSELPTIRLTLAGRVLMIIMYIYHYFESECYLVSCSTWQ